MTLRRIPPQNNRGDWPRRVANQGNDNAKRVSALEAATDWAALEDYADDTAAASGGIEVGQLYRTGNNVRVRIT